jgi:hypothetical protein
MLRIIPFVLMTLSVPAVAKDPDSVTMDLKKFLSIYEKSKVQKDKPQLPPREASIASVDYSGELVLREGEPSAMVFKARVRVDVHKEKGWVRVPLLTNGVALQDARIDGKEAAVVLENYRYQLVTNRKGSFDVDLSFVAAVVNQKGQSRVSFPLISSGSSELTLTIPETELLDFKIANGHDQAERKVRNQRVITATVPSTGNLLVQWQRKVQETEKQDPRVYAEVNTLVSVADGLLHSDVTVKQTILFAGVNQFRFDLPKGATVLDVKGAGLRDWRVDEDGVLTASLNYEAENSYSLTIQLEQVLGDSDKIEAPLVEPLDVERSKGWIGVEARGNLEIAGGDIVEATPVDVRTLPGAIIGRTSNPVLLGYKYLGNETKIPLIIQEHEDVEVLVTLADQAHATTMMTADGRRLTSVKYEVRNNRRQFLRVELPKNAELWSASVGGKAVQPAKADDALLIPLLRSAQGGAGLAAFNVEVVFVEQGSPPSGRFATFDAQLPKIDVPTTYVAWSVYTADNIRVSEKSIKGALNYVEVLSEPLGASDVLTLDYEEMKNVQQAANQVASSGGLDKGAAPVEVRLPLDGVPYHFEKLLVLDETLDVLFQYKVPASMAGPRK